MPAAIRDSTFGVYNVLYGAKTSLKHTFAKDTEGPITHIGQSAASIAEFLDKYGNAVMVTLSYTSAFETLQTWYRQLLAESIGKGRWGIIPVTATGTADQHSQMQLWLDGPREQMFTLLYNNTEHNTVIPGNLEGYPDWFPRRMDKLWYAHIQATHNALVSTGRPVRVFKLRQSHESYGALMTYLMLETVLVADILGIDPFTQPAVDNTKVDVAVMLANLCAKNKEKS